MLITADHAFLLDNYWTGKRQIVWKVHRSTALFLHYIQFLKLHKNTPCNSKQPSLLCREMQATKRKIYSPFSNLQSFSSGLKNKNTCINITWSFLCLWHKNHYETRITLAKIKLQNLSIAEYCISINVQQKRRSEYIPDKWFGKKHLLLLTVQVYMLNSHKTSINAACDSVHHNVPCKDFYKSQGSNPIFLLILQSCTILQHLR